MRVAIVGAGIAGLWLARRLAEAGHRVQVYEKARGPGGRVSTRRTERGHFDHGAQYFTARDPDFLRQLEDWVARGVVERWQGSIVEMEAGKAHPGEALAREILDSSDAEPPY
jgi:predicted NAD/FAD-dependent oxidoreductase